MTEEAGTVQILCPGSSRVVFMPILLHVDDLKPGLCLAQTIYQDDQRLICGNQRLEQWHIDSLRRRCPNILVRVLDPILDSMADFQDNSKNEEVAVRVTSQMSRLMGSVQNKIGSRTALDGSDLSGLKSAIKQVMDYLAMHPVTAAVLIHSSGKTGYLQEHAANVMYLSLLVGNAIRDYVYTERARTTKARTLALRYGMNLTPLALGCLFHDLGMLELEDLLHRDEPLSPEEMDRIRRHPLAGVELLPPETDAVVKMVVRTHHENMNGTGYPAGLPGSKLHVFSRIIRVADAYDAGTSDRVYRQAKVAARVLWEITCGPHRNHYDPLIARILSGMVQPFPIGARIRLNCGRYGVVVRHHRRYPFRPTIMIGFDEDGRRLKKRQLDPPFSLAHREDVRLVEFAGQDLSFLNIYPQPDVIPACSDSAIMDTLDELAASACEVNLFSMVYP